MTKDTQTKLRVMSEEIVEELYAGFSHRGNKFNSMWEQEAVMRLEISRQLALLTEEVHRLNKKLDERNNGH